MSDLNVQNLNSKTGNSAISIADNGTVSLSTAASGSTQTANATGSTTLDFSTYKNFVLTLTGTSRWLTPRLRQ